MMIRNLSSYTMYTQKVRHFRRALLKDQTIDILIAWVTINRKVKPKPKQHSRSNFQTFPGIRFCSNEATHFQTCRRWYSENTLKKLKLKKIFSRTTGPILTKFYTNHSCVCLFVCLWNAMTALRYIVPVYMVCISYERVGFIHKMVHFK